jgi:hypothetical protein
MRPNNRPVGNTGADYALKFCRASNFQRGGGVKGNVSKFQSKFNKPIIIFTYTADNWQFSDTYEQVFKKCSFSNFGLEIR